MMIFKQNKKKFKIKKIINRRNNFQLMGTFLPPDLSLKYKKQRREKTMTINFKA